MKNSDLKQVIRLFLDATSNVVTSARGFDGRCKFCKVIRGQQHDAACPIWKLINARIEHHVLAEGPAAGTIMPEDAMAMLEGGNDFGPTAPKLTFSQNTASDEKGLPF